MARKNVLRVNEPIKRFVDQNGYDKLEKIVKDHVADSNKLKNQIENERRLQNQALKDVRDAKKMKDEAEKKMRGVSDQLIKEQFFDEFFNLGEDLLNGAKTSMNNVWIKAHEDKLKKLCRRM